MDATKERTLVTEDDPDAPYPVPAEVIFGGNDFWHDSKLAHVGERLLATKFQDIPREEVSIAFAWKKKGGTSGGNATLGKCVRLSGAARYFSDGYDFLIWAAADHARGMRLTNYQVEALLYHELLHVEYVESEDGDKPPIIRTRGHDFEGFADELYEYGKWRPSMQTMADAFQAALPLDLPDDRQEAAREAARKGARKLADDAFKDGSGIDSITFSTPHDGRSATLTREAWEAQQS